MKLSKTEAQDLDESIHDSDVLRLIDFEAATNFATAESREVFGHETMFCSECETRTPHVVFVNIEGGLMSEREPRAFCAKQVKHQRTTTIQVPNGPKKTNVDREVTEACGNQNNNRLRVVCVALRIARLHNNVRS